LQAQDRAHRIGQKKTVQVFRLVTDETVEVKVVERAQQKLKLDAMVVQQGRLQEKEKKMSKQDLLDTVRFGAEKIFRSKESDISDADIDLILEQGRKRTEEMNEKLQLADKGDMFDFRLDGGMKTQQFEGVDYSDKAVREQEKLGADWAGGLGFIDTGKRDRKMVTTYAENVARFPKEGENEPGRPKLPRSLKLPKMDDWQFFNRARLNKLQDMEQSLFDQLVDKGELPQSTRDLVLLSPELMEEKNRLLDEGFSNWTKAMFNLFLTNAAKVGRTEIGKIAKEMALPEEEVRRYSETFWRDGPAAFGDDWDNKVKKIEKGEKKIEEISRLSDATAQLIGMFENPWDELTFKGGAGGAGKVFNTTEDRFLLCLTHLHGHGNWDLVRSSIRRCGRFRFDFYLQSCTADQLGKRCEALMRAAERELDDRLRKKESEKDGVAGGGKAESALDRQAHTRKEIAEATRKLTQVRDQLAAAKSGHAAGSKNPQFEAAGGEAAGARKSTGGGGGGGSSSSGGGGAKRPFPERDLAELARLLLDHDAWGVGKVVDHWVAGHPEVSKRQVEVTIQEVAIKEKGHWQIRPTHAHLLTGEAPPAGSAAAAAPAGGKSKAAGKGKADDAKRKREEEEAKPTKAPKKPRKAFGMYSDYILPTATKAIKDMVEYQNAAPERVREGIKACVRSWWDQLVPEERLEWDQKEAEDQKRCVSRPAVAIFPLFAPLSHLSISLPSSSLPHAQVRARIFGLPIKAVARCHGCPSREKTQVFISLRRRRVEDGRGRVVRQSVMERRKGSRFSSV
jgi:SWI/SNF-related matrix-associated actin-dependent regulator of chromatin subfamily A member 5